jgi:hypothetical protein
MPMKKADWQDDLTTCFEDLQVVARCREEAIEHFDRFCDYVAEPAFEALTEELQAYHVKARFWKVRGKSVHLEVRFPKSSVDQFHYILWMPRNAVELRLRLTTKFRKSATAPLEEKTVPFIENVPPAEILKLDHDALAQDVVARYKRSLYEAAVATD